MTIEAQALARNALPLDNDHERAREVDFTTPRFMLQEPVTVLRQEAGLNVSLDQAIDIHAKALTYRYGRTAPSQARLRGHDCSARGDREGHVIWEKVASIAEQLLTAERLEPQG
jgi:hypothetical protein